MNNAYGNTPKIITVSQLNFYIKSLLDQDPNLNHVFLTGEISNLKDHYSSGHIYLSLKDEKSVLNSVMFAGNARRLKFAPEDGMKILARGRVSVYEPTGRYQFYIEDMQPDGTGALAVAFEQLKEKLSKEGLFKEEHKKPIPKFPENIGVITSPTGAAVQDIKNILMRRYPNVNIIMHPVLVQGENAPKQLTDAINLFCKHNAADVIIIGRGGGSVEDLWAFNSEDLAYAIYNCKIPVISAVGHETDFTICDFVSDLRAPTPSAAAELAVPDAKELKASLLAQKQYISTLIDNKVRENENNLNSLKHQITTKSPIININESINNIKNKEQIIVNAINNKYTSLKDKTEKIGASLESLNPISVLNRGYAIASINNKTVSSVKQLKKGTDFTLKLKDGTVKAKVKGE